MVAWHSQTTDQAMRELSSEPEGLSQAEAERRYARYGPNELQKTKGSPALKLFLKQFADPLVIILLVAAAISVAVWLIDQGVEELIDAGVILAIVIINAVLGFYQEYKAERTLEALRDLAAPQVTIVRDGKEIEVPSKRVVPGDVMVLATGDKVSADARLLEAVNLETVEASLTGESTPSSKVSEPTFPAEAEVGDRLNMVHSGTIISRGRGRAVVVATGMTTELGKIAGLVEEAREGTPLQKKLARLSVQLGVAVLAIAVVIFAVGLWEKVPLLEMFLTSVSLAVAAIPEGLPAVVTVCLALGLARMARRNAVVRRLPAVESLGSATVICTDKTGTLTRGEMSVTEIALATETVKVTGEGYAPVGELRTEEGKALVRDELLWLLRAGALCNDSKLVNEDGWKVVGDTTEGTLLVLAGKAGLDLGAMADEFSRVDEIPFDSETKRMITVHIKDARKVAFAKGAAESVLPLCHQVMIGGRVVELSSSLRQEIRARDQEMAGRALRVLALAMKERSDDDTPLEEDLIFLGLVGMIDSPRPEAVEAIARCHRAGIRVIMITGDHERTAEAIAQSMDIGDGQTPAMAGKDLTSMPLEELAARVRKVSVFARVSPEHKVRIVEALQKNGEVVAMTGDGVNDAPALKRADIGVAMGVTGTDVAKEAADIVLTDDNFASIAAAVEEGRGIYDNIRRFVSYLLSCNGGEIALIFTATLLYTDPLYLPFLLPIQILWVNLVTDSFPALALGVEPTDPKVMDRCPRDPREGPLTRAVAGRILAISLAVAAAGLVAFQISLGLGEDVTIARTVAFCTLVLIQLFLVFSFRSERASVRSTGLRGNNTLIFAFLGSLALQLAVVYLPFMNSAFRTAPLSWEWSFIVPLSLSGLAVNEAAKYLERRIRGQDDTCEARVHGD